MQRVDPVRKNPIRKNPVRKNFSNGVERIGVSLDKKLLSMFDKLIAKQGYQSRSEAIRDLVRRQLSDQHLSNPKAKAVAGVFLVYDHHCTELMAKLTNLQHSHLLQTISSLHIHLNEHDCLEVIVLRGRVGEINKMAENILSQKGVKLGHTNFVAMEST
jgi:CopG family nickel-responsive transcriptional regulator